MTDILIGNGKGLEIFVRDVNDDGSFDEGELIGVRGPGDRFEAARVSEALGRVAIEGLRPGARLQRIGAYMDFVREAERWTNEGEFAMAAAQLRQAESFALDNGIVVDCSRMAEMRWRILDGVRDAGAEGLDAAVAKDISTLRRDDDPSAASHSAGMILDLLTARASVANIENSASPGRDRMLSEAREREASLREAIAGRAARIRTVLETGSRATLVDQVSVDGVAFHVGDHVRYRDRETGSLWDTPFLVTGFEIHADGIHVHGVDLPSLGSRGARSGDVDYLVVVPRDREAPRPVPTSPDREERDRLGRFLSRLEIGWGRLLSYLD